MTFLEFIYLVLSIILVGSIFTFIIGAIFYTCSGDEEKKEDRGDYLMALSIVIALFVWLLIFFIKSI